ETIVDEYIRACDAGIRHTDRIVPFFTHVERENAVAVPDLIVGSDPGCAGGDGRACRTAKTFDRNLIPYQAPGPGIQLSLADSFVVFEKIEHERGLAELVSRVVRDIH